MDEAEYFWFRYDGGQWIVFDESALTQIEEARRRGEESVRLANTPYLLNMSFMQQVNENTGYPREIAKAEACWYWLDDDMETWRRYNREDSLKLALAALSPVGDHWTYLEHGQTLYYVDIPRRKQRNTASDYERDIHQGVPPAVPELGDDNDEDDSSVEGGDDPPVFENPVPRHFICPLSKRIMNDPVQTVAGSTYERKYIERHLRRHDWDFSTDIALKSKSLLENRVLRDSIEIWREANAKVTTRESIRRQPKPEEAHAAPTISYTNDYVQSDTHQDTLKVICLGLSSFGTDVALRNPTTAEGKLGVNRYNWKLKTADDYGIHCNVYDFVGQKVHHATQKLFFSPQALYVVVWDLGSEKETLERDIFEKVQFWVETIANHAPGAMILPVVSLDGVFSNTKGNPVDIQMDQTEIQRRCLFLQETIGKERNLCFGPNDHPIPLVGGGGTSDRLQEVKSWILQHSKDPELFPNLGHPIPGTNQLLRDAVANLVRQGTHVVEVDQLSDMLCENEQDFEKALQYLSDCGELLYYGSVSGKLKKFTVLNPDWLVTAVACILLPAMNDSIRTVRRRNSTDGIITDEHELYHGPVAEEGDVRSLWRSQFVSDHGNMKAGIKATTPEQLLDYLHYLFTGIGILVSLNANQRATFPALPGEDPSQLQGVPDSKLLFLPGLLSQRDQAQFVGIYNNSVFSKTTLAQSVQFRSFVSPVVMEEICAAVVGRIYAETRKGGNGDYAQGQLQVKEVLCWRTLLHVKLGLKSRTSTGDTQWSVVDIYAHLVDYSSPLCVGATFMGESRQTLIVTGKGEEGNDGQVIWEGGLRLITDAIQCVLESTPNGIAFERHYFCPSCLARQNLRDARSWSEFMLQIAIGRGEEDLICEDGHTGKTQLVLGTPPRTPPPPPPPLVKPDVSARDLMPGVVMVGLYDEKRQSGKIRKVGSGFVIDSERGLIVTAAHTLMLLWGQENFGRDYDGIEGAKAVIGVIPDNYDTPGGSYEYPPALFRYFATIYKKDPSLEIGECHIDACILQITSRFENDVDGNGDLCSDEISIRLTAKPALMKKQPLLPLTVTQQVHVGESVRILGFDQPDSTRLNRTFGMSEGRVFKQFETKTVGGERYRYTPRKKIILNCPTIGGHSGGPCVNQKGEVIGILSCADFTEKSRCYLVPASEWLALIPDQDEVLTQHCSSSITKVQIGTFKPPPGLLKTVEKPPSPQNV